MKESKIEYFLKMSDLVSSASPDPATKCGCVLTDNDARVVGTGYNGFAKGTEDNWPLSRPEKYLFVIHSELNAIINSNVILRHIGGGYAFVNRQCCHSCLIHMHNFGIHTVYQINRTFSSVNMEAINKVLEETKIKSFLVDLN